MNRPGGGVSSCVQELRENRLGCSTAHRPVQVALACVLEEDEACQE